MGDTTDPSNPLAHHTVRIAKALARAFSAAWSEGSEAGMVAALKGMAAPDYKWRGSYPYGEIEGVDAVCASLYRPLRAMMASLVRHEFLAIAGFNDADEAHSVWSCSLGHFTGPFTAPWLGLRPTGKLVRLRYAEFHRVADGKIAESALFFDLADFLQQVGLDPFPDQLGARHIFPPPRRGLSGLGSDSAARGRDTMALLNRMIADLDLLNKSGEDTCPPEFLERTWRADMAWYGPAGIGSMMSIPLYQEQHQFPFRQGLTNKQYLGHVARIAEGDFAAFFGWPNLSNSPRGGYLGLPASDVRGEMRIVDVYRRQGDRLAENWVIIDFPYYFKAFGIDLLANAVATQAAS
ncbi:MAG: ester cyclase [Pseudomonadota bacterium]